jgi:hypothetical protein
VGSLVRKKEDRGPIRDKSGIYHYRRRIPDDVRRVLRYLDADSEGNGPKRDKREEKKRLGRNQAYAQAAWEMHDRAVEARWAELRSGRPTGLTPIHIQALAGEITGAGSSSILPATRSVGRAHPIR